GAEIGASYRIFDSFRSHTFWAAWSLTHSAPIEELPIPVDPNAMVWPRPRYGYSGFTRFRYAYSDARRHTYDITPSEGRRFSIDAGVRRPTRGMALASGSSVV